MNLRCKKSIILHLKFGIIGSIGFKKKSFLFYFKYIFQGSLELEFSRTYFIFTNEFEMNCQELCHKSKYLQVLVIIVRLFKCMPYTQQIKYRILHYCLWCTRDCLANNPVVIVVEHREGIVPKRIHFRTFLWV